MRKHLPKRHKKYGDYERVVRFPIFSDYTVHIIFTKDIKESNIKRYGSFNVGDCDACHRSSNNGHAHLFFKLGDCSSGNIAHEAWHAIHSLFIDFAGVGVMENEVVAYHLGHLVQEISYFKNDLIDAGAALDENALTQAKVLGIKSSTKKRTHARRRRTRSQKTNG